MSSSNLFFRLLNSLFRTAESSSQKARVLTLALRLEIGISGIIILVIGLFNPLFRDVEGYLKVTSWLPVIMGLALLILALALTSTLQHFAFWFSLALVGQAAALQLIEAGKMLHFQHYVPLSSLFSEENLFFSLILIFQLAAVALGLRKYFPSLRIWVMQNIKFWQIVILLVVFVLTSAALTRELERYLLELIIASTIQILFLGNLVLAVLALPEDVRISIVEKLDRWLKSLANNSLKRWIPDLFTLLVAAWITILTAFLSLIIYQNHPHVQDEVIYLFHARYLAERLLSVPAPPVSEAFSLYMIPYNANRWYSIFPPGWPAILSLGVLSGLPWLVNPLISGINVILVNRFISEIYNQRVARWVVVLLVFSPWYIFLGMSFMAHMATLFFALIAAIAIIKARKTGFVHWAIVAGIGLGAVSLIRLVDGLILGMLLGLWALGLGGKRLRTSCLVAFGVTTMAVGAINLGNNQLLLGDPLTFPLNAYYDEYFGLKSNAFGFGPERGLGWAIDAFPGHSPIEAVLNAALNAYSLNIELFGWGMGSLLFSTFAIISGKLKRSDYLMIAIIVTTIGVLSLYWFGGGPDFGARYWFLMIIPLVALTARGLLILKDMLTSSTAGSASVTIMVGCLLAITLINYIPWRSLDKYFHYLGMRPDVRTLAKEINFGKSIVLVQGELFPDYESAWVYNPLFPDEDQPIYAWDKSPEVRQQVLNSYQDRTLWIIEGPSITLQGYRISAGPIPASEFLEN